MAIPVENGDLCDNDNNLDLTFSDLCSHIDSIDASLNFAIKTKILPSRAGLNCIRCQEVRTVVWTKRLSQSNVPYILFCKSCRKTISLCRNTVLSGCKFNVKQFFQCTYCWLLGLSSKEGSSQCNLALDVCQGLYSQNQQVCYIVMSRDSRVLGGPDLTVEIGDIVITRKKHITKPGQKTKIVSYKDIVYLGYCFETKDCFLLKVDRADLNTLLEVIMIMVLPGSKIIIDSCSKYSEFAVENYDISFHTEDLGIPDKIDHRRLKFPSGQNEPLNFLQQFYFKRRSKWQTASQRFHPFIKDLVRVYPGYGKTPIKPMTLVDFAAKTHCNQSHC